MGHGYIFFDNYLHLSHFTYIIALHFHMCTSSEIYHIIYIPYAFHISISFVNLIRLTFPFAVHNALHLSISHAIYFSFILRCLHILLCILCIIHICITFHSYYVYAFMLQFHIAFTYSSAAL